MTMGRKCLLEEVDLSPKLNNELPTIPQSRASLFTGAKPEPRGKGHDMTRVHREQWQSQNVFRDLPPGCVIHIPRATPGFSSRTACCLVMSDPQEGTGSFRTRWALGGCR